MTENEIAEIVFKCALKVHRSLGPGLLESTYEACLFYELKEWGLKVEKQKKLPVIYNDVELEVGYVIDLMVEDKFIIELKAVKEITNVHLAQTLTYLRLSNCKLGFLMNFNVSLLKTGVKRVINGKL
ncbi:MAG: GxxExxY protein [Chitinophagales bacterium]